MFRADQEILEKIEGALRLTEYLKLAPKIIT
jgi:hypothetical protein